MASSEIKVDGIDATYNATLFHSNIDTKLQPVSSIFIFRDNAETNCSLEAVQVPTEPLELNHVFVLNEQSSISLPLEHGRIPTQLGNLRQIFVVREFVKYQKSLTYPLSLFNDTIPPKILNVTFDGAESNQIRINWTTDEFASSEVKYGVSSGDFEETKKDDLFTKNHSISLDRLLPGTRYYFVINSKDRSGNSGETQASSSEI